MGKTDKIQVALIDDHVLLRNGLASVINSFDEYEVVFEADNGKQLDSKLKLHSTPDIILMDINMPFMDGFTTTKWLGENFPLVKVLALSMYDNEAAIIKMIRAGARGYILKDCEPPELKQAMNSIHSKGFYYSELITGHLIHSINNLDPTKHHLNSPQLNTREIEFLKLVCTELTYKEIADKLNLSPRTIDGYRDQLFDKLNIKTRVGLAMYAIKNGIVNVESL